MSGFSDRVGAAFSGLIEGELPDRIGVAVSGGSDSLGLMLGLNDWARELGISVLAVTVDHGLRPEAAEEAMGVANVAADHGIPHDTLKWQGWDGQGNLQDQARRARYGLMAEWAQRHGISHIALGHTEDDQAETLLMRLARGAGVDGLAAIPECRVHDEVAFLRPLLGVARADIQAYLTATGQAWVEDPSNEDTQYDRVKIRKSMAVLADLGMAKTDLIQVAKNMSSARNALNYYTYLAARDVVTVHMCDILIDAKGFHNLPGEIRRRLMIAIMQWIAGPGYPPRGRALTLMIEAAMHGNGMTLGGVRLLSGEDQHRLTREYAAVSTMRTPVGQDWDGRWKLYGPEVSAGHYVAALGEEGLLQCPDWRASGLPHASMQAVPALWHGQEVAAAPIAGMGSEWDQLLLRDEEVFFSTLKSQ